MLQSIPFMRQYGYNYANALQVFNLRTLHGRRHKLHAIFVINDFLGSKPCLSTMDIIRLREPTRNLRDFLCFMLVHPIKIVPPAGVQLPHIQFIINWISSEGKLSQLIRCDSILLHYFKVSLLII